MTAVEVVREMARLFQSGDAEGAYALFAPDIVIEQPSSLPHGGRYVGRDGMAAMAAAIGQNWTRSTVDPRIFGGDEQAVQITRQTWTATATGREATVNVAEVLTVTGGVITSIRVFPQDTHALLATLDRES